MILTKISTASSINDENEFSSPEIIDFTELKRELIQLRWERNYWKAIFKRTRQREAELKNELEISLKRFRQREEELKNDLEKSISQIRYLRRQLYAKKTEKKGKKDGPRISDKNKEEIKKRGQQPGACGHGRRDHSHLPVVIEPVGFEESECCCSTCGKPIIELASVDESEQLEIEVRSYRRRIRKKKWLLSRICG